MRAEEYDLTLDIDYRGESFRGVLVARLAETAPLVELDSIDLAVDSVQSEGASVPFEVDAGRQKLVIRTGVDGPAHLEIRYSGKVRRDVLNGFYVSRDGERTFLTTMMQPIGCRRLMPCVDEPNQKAVIRLRVKADEGLTVITNADVVSTAPADGRVLWTFAPTPRMSTYLLYLGVGPFELRETTYEGIRVVAAAAPGKVARAQRALELAGPILKAYEAYYGLRYPLPKLHLVAIPDFWAGGMENWGAIVFPEIGLLWDDSTGPSVLRWAYETLTHEIAHQWFGNLVTFDTFDDAWLNESFATFVAAKMESRLKLRTDAWAELLIRAAPGWFADSLQATHPIKLKLQGAAEISQSFDDITYYKGANVVRMIENFLGEDVFRTGVADYLARYQYGNAKDDDLWAALENASGQPVPRVMRAWVERPGLPVLQVRRAGSTLHLEQRRFTFAGSADGEAPWPVPLIVRDGEVVHRRVFDSRTGEIALEHPERFQINPGRSAFIRVAYDPALRADLLRRFEELDPFDRWAFANDSAAFALSGEISPEEYLAVAHRARSVTDYPSVVDVGSTLRLFRLVLAGHPGFERTFLDFYRAQLDRLTLAPRPGEPDTDPILRQMLVNGLALADAPFARSLAARFDRIDDEPPALRLAISLAFARTGGAPTIDRLFQRLTAGPNDEAAEEAAVAMEGLPTEGDAAEVLRRASVEPIRTTHLGYLVWSVAENPVGRDHAWAWLQANLREFERKSEGSWMLSNLLRHTIPCVGLDRPAEVREYFRRESFPEGSTGVRRGLEMLEVYRALRERARASIVSTPIAR